MPGHDIIVIGSSAGGIDALVQLATALPPDLGAALFVVQHIAAEARSLLPEILSNVGPLPASHPTDGAPIERGCIYVAPPDHHMLVENGHIHVMRGQKENSFRPAIDATFRTAARAYGPRVVGVILTGMLDDGTAGLLAVKRRGGVALVQEPAEAAFPSMPTSAIRYVNVDAVLSVAEIPPMLVYLVNELVEVEGEGPMSDNIELEARISELDREALQQADTLGTPAPFSCPDCGGVLVEFYDGDLLRFRCQVGHAFSRDSLMSSHASLMDYQLWGAFNALDERVNLARRLARDARKLKDSFSERRFTQLVEQAETQKELVRQALLKEEEVGATAGVSRAASAP